MACVTGFVMELVARGNLWTTWKKEDGLKGTSQKVGRISEKYFRTGIIRLFIR